MNLKEKQIQSAEKKIGNLLTLDPTELMRDNPAALIVNKESYDRMSAHFSPEEQLDPPQVVWVQAYSSEHGEVLRLFVLDGLTRTKYINDHQEEIKKKHPNFVFQVRNVTNSVLENPLIVPPSEKQKGQIGLTMTQYLRAVVPPTIEHSEIATDRIAAHLINGWEQMIGKDISEKFSALAALSFIANPKIPTATNEMLTKFLSTQPEIMSKETVSEREILQKSILELVSIIRESKLFKEQVAKSAFILVGSASPVIGGQKETINQIYGLMHLPTIEKKLNDAFPNIAEREEARKQLGLLASDIFAKFAKEPNGEQTIDDLQESLKNNLLSYDQILEVFTSPSPSEDYLGIRQGINRERLKKFYLETKGKKQLTSYEDELINQFGTRTYLDDRELPSLNRAIANSVNSLLIADNFRGYVEKQRANLIEKGVKADTLSKAILKIAEIRKNIFSSSPQTLSARINELNNEIENVRHEISFQLKTHQIGQIVDEIYGEKLKSAEYGLQIRREIVGYIRKADLKELMQIRKRLHDLKSLTEDLQSKVLSGDMTIAYALQEQKKRTIIEPEIQKTIERSILIENDVLTETSDVIHPIETKREEKPTVIIDRQKEERIKAEKERRRIINERLGEDLQSSLKTLSELSPKPDEIAEDTKTKAKEVLNKWGRLLFDHPDIARAIEDYPGLLREVSRLRSIIVQREQEEIEKDNRTR